MFAFFNLAVQYQVQYKTCDSATQAYICYIAVCCYLSARSDVVMLLCKLLYKLINQKVLSKPVPYYDFG